MIMRSRIARVHILSGKPLKHRLQRGARRIACLGAAWLAACSFAPPVKTPDVPTAAAYKEAPSDQGVWHDAAAYPMPETGQWWRVFGDATLNGLEARLAHDNPQLAAAIARHDAASADLDVARSGLLPQISLDVDSEQNRQSDYRPLRGATQPSVYGSHTAAIGVSYELDLWGRVRNEVREGHASAAASADDANAVRLSLEADLADAYFATRGLDDEADMLTRTAAADQRALELTERRHAGGLSSALDVDRARTERDSVSAQLDRNRRARAASEHALATLAGTPASLFTLPVVRATDAVPNIPPGVPAQLLLRRPDIAAAQQRVVAATAQIGVARAAWFPDVTLGLNGGYQSTAYGDWFSAPARFWSIGPELAVSLFDGGRRSATDRKAQAGLDEAGATYRQVSLQAFREVEDQLANVRELRHEADHERAAVRDAQGALTLALEQYRDGAIDYLEVVTAQTTALDERRALIATESQRRVASVDLIRALGGGWQGATATQQEPPEPSEHSEHSDTTHLAARSRAGQP